MSRRDVPGRPRKSGFVSLAQLPLPDGAPPCLYGARRVARIRAALGARLAPYLVDAHVDGERVVLVLAGEHWDRALAGLRETLERQLAAALERDRIVLEVRSDPGRIVNNPSNGPRFSVDSPGDAADTATRLRRVAERLLAGRNRSQTET